MRGHPLHDGDVSMEPIEKETAVELFPEWIKDPEVRRYLGTFHYIPDASQEEEWYESAVKEKDRYVWQIEYGEHGVVGISSITHIDFINGWGVTGTIIGEKDVWGQGVGTKTMLLRARFAFDELGLYGLESFAFTENKGSVKALKKCSYVVEGVTPGRYYRMGKRWDIVSLYLTREGFYDLHRVA